MSDSVDPNELNKAKLNLETAKIAWADLQRYFASGHLLAVAPDLDIVSVAHSISIDDKTVVEAWLNEKKLNPVSDDQARNWHERQAYLWAVVVRPWVLVQDRD
ncbi:DUF2288 domain-containing protein [Endozoicomonas arenosclerae]|uniref:DUF2288 domain-containing protein n=1 Tax=Endozoicomonas arenosclerae TaxID=1633495 RepID=UPI0007807993|nr:DUF2288 domain-containing protein [Endozoicomonas arenosclerae]